MQGRTRALFARGRAFVGLGQFTDTVNLLSLRSAIARTNQNSYELTGNVYSVWGFEYEPGENGYVTWWIDGKKAWTMRASAVGADLRAQISQRPIPKEPMVSLPRIEE